MRCGGRGRPSPTKSTTLTQPASGAAAPPVTAEVVIIGAGPCGLFQVFELGLLGISAHILDSLAHPGGQCAELYPDKPIYDIPALPVCGAQELVDRLLQQIKPFKPEFHLGQEVVEFARQDNGRFHLNTAGGVSFDAGAVVIAAGVGSFQPRRIGIEGSEAFEGGAIQYRVSNAAELAGKRLVIFGGGDSALDWTLELLARAASVDLVHRRHEFRAAPASVAKMREQVAAGRMRCFEALPHALVHADGVLQRRQHQDPRRGHADARGRPAAGVLRAAPEARADRRVGTGAREARAQGRYREVPDLASRGLRGR